MLRDILQDKTSDIGTIVQTVARVSPDILVLTGIDWDYGGAALDALADRFEDAGEQYPHQFALKPNRGIPTGVDLDGDGYSDGPADAHGFGWFTGQNGMAILSKYPIDKNNVQDLSGLLWADFPNALLPEIDGKPFPSAEAIAVQRLSTTGHWVVPIETDHWSINLLAYAAGTPVFDGPEDRKGRRNHDENLLWLRYLEGALPFDPPEGLVVIAGNANQDPKDGEGLKDAINAVLGSPRLRDPMPMSDQGRIASSSQGGPNVLHHSDPVFDTVDWADDDGDAGNLRVSYVLPDSRLEVVTSGVFWPGPGDPLFEAYAEEDAPQHRLVWVDVDFLD